LQHPQDLAEDTDRGQICQTLLSLQSQFLQRTRCSNFDFLRTEKHFLHEC